MKSKKRPDTLTPKQILFLSSYLSPASKTFSNAKQSAIEAGYAEDYADNIMAKLPDWMVDNVGKKKGMLVKAEQVLYDVLGEDDRRIAVDSAKFIASRLGKNDGYSERQELTGANGTALPSPILANLVKIEAPNKTENA